MSPKDTAEDINQPSYTPNLEAQSPLPCTVSQLPGAQPAVATAGLLALGLLKHSIWLHP